MFPLRNYDKVQVGGGEKTLPAGAYVAQIVAASVAKSKAQNDTLCVAVDIVEGEYHGYFRRHFERIRKNAPNARWTNSGTIYCRILADNGDTFWSVKKFLETVKQDNPSKVFTVDNGDFDESKLIGATIGIVVGNREDEKTDKNGNHYTRAFIDEVVPLEQVRNNTAKIPELEKFNGTKTEQPANNNNVTYEGKDYEYESPF